MAPTGNILIVDDEERIRFFLSEILSGDGHTVTAAADGPHEAFEVGERAQVLRHALRVLTPDERLAIETVFFSELTYADAAQALNQPLGTVKTRIRSGLAKLRRALTQGMDSP